MRIHTDCEWVETGVKDILDATVKGKTPTKREHLEVWTLIEERIKSFPTGWLEIEHVPGHATEAMVSEGRALEEHRLANTQVDLLAKQGAASGGPPREMIEAYLERAERTRRQQEMAIEILEERDHLEEIAPQAEQDPRVTDEVRDMQKPVFYQVMERRVLSSGTWVDRKPKPTIDTELTAEHKNELVSAWVRNKAEAEGDLMETTWDWDQTLWTHRNRQRWTPEFLSSLRGLLERNADQDMQRC